MRLIVKPEAEQDLEAIGDYIARDNPQRAIAFVRELRDHCKTIARNPLGYRERTELAVGLRSCAHGNYVIFFDVLSDAVEIIRVLHGTRDVPTVLADP